jgi:xanthine dehydrogenase accessory factor
MPASTAALRAFLDRAPALAIVEVTEALGSTPREQGAWMLVAPDAIFGTIGGGQLEFMAIDKAREMLAAGPSQGREGAPLTLSIPLGPEIGQCCGGRVGLSIGPVDAAKRQALLEKAEGEDAALPQVLIFGGGHVGRALAAALALLPVRAVVIETRADALEAMPDAVETRLTAVPEEFVREAPAGAAYVVLTHDHALDFLIVAEALKRTDAAYVGMIGSQTKRATFASWYLKTAGGSEHDLARLVSPIGGDAVHDKRPAVIAALAAAEILTALSKA